MAEIPERYSRFNTLQTKEPVVIVEIEGAPHLLSSTRVQTRIRYGDPIKYGEGYVYGGLRDLTDSEGNAKFKSLLSLDGSSLTLSQRLEPEQGRGAISTLSLAFVDKDQYMSKLISPNVFLDEILGKNVKVWLGYSAISYPEDFFVVFRGVISQAQSSPGLVRLQLSDANIKRRSKLFYKAVTKLVTAFTASPSNTDVIVASTGDFHKPIIGPDGNYDPAITCYLSVEDEFIKYDQTSFNISGVEFNNLVRGQRGSTVAAHNIGTDVTPAIQIEDHVIDMALKIMLSGWNGPFETNVPVRHLSFTGDPILGDQPDAIIVDFDANDVYGLEPGDYITVSGATNPGNNQTVRIAFLDSFEGKPNRIIYTDGTFVNEANSPAKMAFRSQFDTYPVTCGLKLKPRDVDVARHIELKNNVLSSDGNRMRFFITDEESSAKSWIEKELYLPVAAYSLTRFGRMSAGITRPPIASQDLKFLKKDNVLNAPQISPIRGLNLRSFFNEIVFQWDHNDGGRPTQKSVFVDTESLSKIGISSGLPITSKGSRTDLGSDDLFEERARFFLSRYKSGAETIGVKVDWGTGNQIEAGDIVALKDDGDLQITNLSTGDRNNGVKLYEVTERSLDIKSGNTDLKLVSGVGGEADDRYGTIAPTSDIIETTATTIRIQDSWGELYPGNESKKWSDYVGEKVLVHNEDWSYSQEVTLLEIDAADRYLLRVSAFVGPLPPAGCVLEIPEYPTDPNRAYAGTYKAVHAFLDPKIDIVSGLTDLLFEVAPADIVRFFVGAKIIVHNYDWSVESPEVTVTNVDTGTNRVTVNKSLGFTPSSLEYVELVGFNFDESGPYRFY